MINMKRKHNPHNYWTYERCKEEALKYQTKNEFYKLSSVAYNKCIKQKWYQELTSHMTKFHNPHNYWTYERCKEEALKYQTKKEFAKGCPSGIDKCLKSGWYKELTSHMNNLIKPNNYWTYERCKEEALKYDDRMIFQKESSGCMDKCIKSGWYKELTSHMKNGRNFNNYWTYERCKEEALKYQTKKDFRKNSNSCYAKCCINNWIDEFTSHMKNIGNSHKRCIYAYEFENNYVYVGLTYNLDNRINRRLKDENDTVTKFIKLYNFKPNIKQLTEYVDVEKAKKLEGFYVEQYHNNGWNILNIAKTGAIGSNSTKFTFDKCKVESLKYSNITDFRKNNISCVWAIYKNKWHVLLEPLKIKETLTFEHCVELAKNCKNRSEFYKKHSTIVKKVLKNGWKDQLFKEVNL